jgi:hypothetical protein
LPAQPEALCFHNYGDGTGHGALALAPAGRIPQGFQRRGTGWGFWSGYSPAILLCALDLRTTQLQLQTSLAWLQATAGPQYRCHCCPSPLCAVDEQCVLHLETTILEASAVIYLTLCCMDPRQLEGFQSTPATRRGGGHAGLAWAPAGRVPQGLQQRRTEGGGGGAWDHYHLKVTSCPLIYQPHIRNIVQPALAGPYPCWLDS